LSIQVCAAVAAPPVFAALQLAGTPAEARRLARTAVAALPEDDFPHLLAASDAFVTALSSDEEFDAGLDVLLAGLQQSAAQTP
jgi:hypothetical protein